MMSNVVHAHIPLTCHIITATSHQSAMPSPIAQPSKHLPRYGMCSEGCAITDPSLTYRHISPSLSIQRDHSLTLAIASTYPSIDQLHYRALADPCDRRYLLNQPPAFPLVPSAITDSSLTSRHICPSVISVHHYPYNASIRWPLRDRLYLPVNQPIN